MSKQSVLDFFHACASDDAMLEHYSTKSLAALLLHARMEGYDISQEDLTDVIGAMEVDVIMQRLGEQIDGNSSLTAVNLRLIQQDPEIRFSLVIRQRRTIPRLDQRIDTGLLRLQDVSLDGGEVAGMIKLRRLVRQWLLPRQHIEPGVIESQHKFVTGLRIDRCHAQRNQAQQQHPHQQTASFPDHTASTHFETTVEHREV